MVQINFALREVNVKIVYYGPGRSGKTTNLEVIHAKAPKGSIGDMMSIATETDRTLFFDFLPLDLGKVAGMNTKFQLYTVPGQVYYKATRKLVLQGADGVVFVADSQKEMMEENLQSLADLEENLRENGLDINNLPIVFQWNKRDLDNILSEAEINQQINRWNAPAYGATAISGDGVFPTLKALASQIIQRLNREHGYGDGTEGGAQEQAAPPPPAPPPPASSEPHAPPPPPPPATPESPATAQAAQQLAAELSSSAALPPAAPAPAPEGQAGFIGHGASAPPPPAPAPAATPPAPEPAAPPPPPAEVPAPPPPAVASSMGTAPTPTGGSTIQSAPPPPPVEAPQTAAQMASAGGPSNPVSEEIKKRREAAEKRKRDEMERIRKASKKPLPKEGINPYLIAVGAVILIAIVIIVWVLLNR